MKVGGVLKFKNWKLINPSKNNFAPKSRSECKIINLGPPFNILRFRKYSLPCAELPSIFALKTGFEADLNKKLFKFIVYYLLFN